MKPIARYFKQMCASRYEKLGFAQHKAAFARVRGDVVQAFNCKRDPAGDPYCTVAFSVVPLCLPQPVYLDDNLYEMNHFFTNRIRTYGWSFDPASNDSKVQCVEILAENVDKYVLPLFERCNNCGETLTELIQLEELFERNRLEFLRKEGREDRAKHWEGEKLFDHQKYYLALGSGNVAYAKKYLDFHIKYEKELLEHFLSPDTPRRPAHIIESCEEPLARYLEDRERLERGIENFDEILRSNEEKMREYLLGMFPKIQLEG